MKISKSQTLITGVYRAGTEYISLLINCHPDISASMYKVNALRFIYDRYNPIEQKANYLSALDDLQNRLQKRYGVSLNRQEIEGVFSACDRLSYGIFYDVVMSSFYLKNNEEHWAEKNQLMWREVPLFLEMMPNGKAILVIRDPRSVLSSFKKYTYAPEPGYLGAVFNCLDAMKHGLEYKSKYSSDRFLCVKYEDVVLNPVETVRGIWDFLELEAKDVRVDQFEWTDAYGQPWHANSSFHSNDNLTAFDIEASIDRWKQGLSEREIVLTEKVCGDLMGNYGYKLSGLESDWADITELFINDDTMAKIVKNWQATGQGIQAFPTNPLDPKNWEESRISNRC